MAMIYVVVGDSRYHERGTTWMVRAFHGSRGARDLERELNAWVKDHWRNLRESIQTGKQEPPNLDPKMDFSVEPYYTMKEVEIVEED